MLSLASPESTKVTYKNSSVVNTRHLTSVSAFAVAFCCFVFINIIALPYTNVTLPRRPIGLSSTNKELTVVGKIASWWLAKAYFAEHKPPDVVFLGSSQSGALLAADAYCYDRLIDLTDNHRSYLIENDLKALLHKDLRVLVLGLPGAMILRFD